MNNWSDERLGNVIKVNPPVKLVKGQVYPFIDIDKVSSQNSYVTNAEVKQYEGQSCSKFEDGDTVFSRITPCLENRKIAKTKLTSGAKAFGSTEFYVFRSIKGKTDNSFVYYFVSSDFVVLPAINSMTGASGRQRADRKFIERIKVQLPPLDTQKRIAEILSAYDDLIENNNNRIVLLEEAAESVYKEWFVRMRFPNYHFIHLQNGIPQGWEVKRLNDFGRIETGKTPPTANTENYGGDIMFIKTPDMHGQPYVVETGEYLTEMGHDTQPKKLLPANSISVSCIGTGGIVAINSEPAHTNQQINSIILDDQRYLEWLYFTAKALKPTVEMFGATGATMTNLSKGKFEKLKVICPNKELIYDFNQITSPMLEEIKELQKQNRNLVKQRDLLLPRLMSGKLVVK